MDLAIMYIERQEEKRRINAKLEEGKRMRDLRISFDFNQEDIADYLSVKVESIQKIEEGYFEGEYASVKEAYEVFLQYNEKELELEAINGAFKRLIRNLQGMTVAIPMKRGPI